MIRDFLRVNAPVPSQLVMSVLGDHLRTLVANGHATFLVEGFPLTLKDWYLGQREEGERPSKPSNA